MKMRYCQSEIQVWCFFRAEIASAYLNLKQANTKFMYVIYCTVLMHYNITRDLKDRNKILPLHLYEYALENVGRQEPLELPVEVLQ